MQKEQYETPVLEVVEVWGAVRTDSATGEADPGDNVINASDLSW